MWRTAAAVFAPLTLVFVAGIFFNRATSAFARVESHGQAIVRAARESGIDPALLAALIYVESGGRALVHSPAGAVGLGQLRPGAAEEARGWLERRSAPGDGASEPVSTDLSDPAANARLAAAYLAMMTERFDDVDLALAAYVAGPAAITDRLREASGDRAKALQRMLSTPGGPGEYVRRVRSFEERFRERGFPDRVEAR